MSTTLQKKQLTWYTLALMTFSMVWGFANVVNNYATQGLSVVVSWVLICALFFAPYVLMVGEMGATFPTGQAGVGSWIRLTMGAGFAYFAGWTYWVVHIPYLAQKAQSVMIAFGWAINGQDSLTKGMGPMLLQGITLAIFFAGLFLASRGIKSLKLLGTIAGSSMLIMSFLYIILMFAAPMLRGVPIATQDWSWANLMPHFDWSYFATLGLLVFAVGGSEKISPYVKETRNVGKEFPKAMMFLVLLIASVAILGSISMAMMFDSQNIPKDLQMNGAYYAFQKLGQHYGLGNFFLLIYALANGIGQVTALVFSIDAPLKVLLAEDNRGYLPRKFTQTNNKGVPVYGYLLTAILVSILIIIPSFGIKQMNELFKWLLNLNAIVMPMRYLWVFVAYFALKTWYKQTDVGYRFLKNARLGQLVALWCFAFVSFACIMGMRPKVAPEDPAWMLQLVLNIAIPFILIILGFIFPWFARKEKDHVIG
jgi:amino acid transporter